MTLEDLKTLIGDDIGWSDNMMKLDSFEYFNGTYHIKKIGQSIEIIRTAIPLDPLITLE